MFASSDADLPFPTNKTMKTLLSSLIVLAFPVSLAAQIHLPSVTLRSLDGKTVDTKTWSNDGKPIIVKVRGYCIGGGHELHVMCDLTIAADNAIFQQTGPKVGSFDGGYGSSYLARIIGQKKAREIWYLCRQYDAQQALVTICDGKRVVLVPQRQFERGFHQHAGRQMRRPGLHEIPHADGAVSLEQCHKTDAP